MSTCDRHSRGWASRLMAPSSWPSLIDQLEVADELFGPRGVQLVAAWFEEQVARIDDPELARSFSDHIDLPGVKPADYAHHFAHSSSGGLLGGIRFYGRDIERPFVEVVSHSFKDLDALRDCVRVEWSMFTPDCLRLRSRPGRMVGPYVSVDVSIYAARYCEMLRPKIDIALDPFDNAEEAIEIVSRRFGRLAVDAPDLARNVSPASSEDLRLWHESDQLRSIRVNGTTVGLLAIAPGRIGWIEGDEINEEIVEADYAGHRYAAAAQSAWARHVARDPQTLLLGTVDRLNIASRKTAEHAGRRRVLDDIFISL
jgi:hypothetical protein